MWRTVYLSKLPRFEKKLRVALDWTLDLLFAKNLVQFETLRTKAVSHTRDNGGKVFHPSGAVRRSPPVRGKYKDRKGR
jgi:hypothetical protein